MCSSRTSIFSLLLGGASSLDVVFLAAEMEGGSAQNDLQDIAPQSGHGPPNTMPSVDKIPTAAPALLMASMAYST